LKKFIGFFSFFEKFNNSDLDLFNKTTINYEYLYPEVLSVLRNENIAIWAWPTTTEDEILPSIKTGVDGIMGDNPALAVKLANRKCR